MSKILFQHIINIKFIEIFYLYFFMLNPQNVVHILHLEYNFRLATHQGLKPHVANGYQVGQCSSRE